MTSPRRPGYEGGERDEQEPVVIRDKRRIDTGSSDSATLGVPTTPNLAQSVGGPVGDADRDLAERTADLQRVQAEFANYRKRVDRDRVLIGELAVGGVLASLLPVLDDIDRARTHGDLTGPLKAVADQLDTVLGKLGLQSFGDVGDTFDPARHEAVMHDESDDVDAPTTTTIMRRGYQHGDRLLRAAMVGVTDPITTRAGNPATNATIADDDE